MKFSKQRSPEIPQNFFISATGTDVGKTTVCAAISLLCTNAGKKCAVMKPVQTGTEECIGDIQKIRKINPAILPLPEEVECPFSFRYPASPHLAAQMENREIVVQKIRDSFRSIQDKGGADIILVEGAGGLMVPIGKDFMMIDLIRKLGTKVILVSPASLGTINHTLLSIEALGSRSIECAGIIINRMPPEPGPVEKDNIKTLEKLSGVPVIAVMNEMPGDETRPDKYFTDSSKLMELLQL